MEHQGTVFLETNRLILRKFTMHDTSAAFNNWESDEKVTQFLRWNAAKDISEVEKIVSSWVNEYKNPSFYQWAIVPKEIPGGCEPVGTISAPDVDERISKVEIAYCIGSKWWNRGYATEAFQAVIPFFFEKVKVNRIEAKHDPNNPASGKVMKKCGLKYEGTLRKAWWNSRGLIDVCIYGILAEDYFCEAKMKGENCNES